MFRIHKTIKRNCLQLSIYVGARHLKSDLGFEHHFLKKKPVKIITEVWRTQPYYLLGYFFDSFRWLKHDIQ
jgi:hypothetical protein